MKRTYQHTIDLLFPIALFFVFSAAALTALLLAANIYRGIVTDSEAQFEQTTALSYVATKIHQNDRSAEKIYLTDFEGETALAIEQTYSDVSFVTYIYETEGELKELFIQKGVHASLKNGTPILKVKDFQMEEIEDNLLKFTCISSDEQSSSVIVSIQSMMP